MSWPKRLQHYLPPPTEGCGCIKEGEAVSFVFGPKGVILKQVPFISLTMVKKHFTEINMKPICGFLAQKLVLNLLLYVFSVLEFVARLYFTFALSVIYHTYYDPNFLKF